ncbi:peptidoglycan-binding protein [Actinokineospora sp.]|uniref:peptidoglycan-binding protein n=1 Tax=Actinokineospora sp. TaxID=1872133 RepID=UPI003D6B608A
MSRKRTGRVVFAAAAVLSVGAATAAATGFGFDTAPAATEDATTLPPKTAKVARQTLVDAQTESGELGFGEATTLVGKLDGTVTALPATATTLERGQALCHLDNTPVVLLYGSLPAYRTLESGVEGADVRQFEENLAALGYRGFTVDDTYSAATVTAVKKWQDNLGLTATGTVEHGRIVYAPGAIRVHAHKAALGEVLKPGAALLTYSGTSRVVTVELDTSDQRLAVKDAPVTVKLPEGAPVPGKITQVETVIKPAEGQSAASTKIEVTVKVDDESTLAGLDQAAMEVGFAAARRENVLTVPVAALLALAEGGYGVQVVDGATTRTVAVKTGLFAAGRVEVSGDGISDGTTVGMPS